MRSTILRSFRTRNYLKNFWQAALIALLLSTSRPCWAQEEQKPLVTAHLWGQIGNQLFLTAAALGYAWDHDAIAIFPDLNRSDCGLSQNRDSLFFRLEAPLESPRPFTHYFSEANWHSSEKIPFQPDQILYGHYQSWKHFDHHREKILEIFAPKESIKDYLQTRYADLLAYPHTVAVHVRTFNQWLHDSKMHPFVGLDYYKRAMDLFPADTLFVVFSDRINWCKEHFPTLGKYCLFIEEGDSIKELFLMSMMKHQIICNSTFSWWAAYFNENPDQIVIAPRWWQHPDYYAFPPPQPNDFYFPHWIVVEQNLSEPYPVDVTWYDVSQSLHEG